MVIRMGPSVTLHGEGREIAYGGDRIRVLYESEGLAVAEFIVPSMFGGPRPHRHHEFEEGFYVLDGVITLFIGEAEVELSGGSFAMVPRGERHTFSNQTDESARVLGYWVPGSGLALLEDVGGLMANGPADLDSLAEVYRKHNSELA